MPKNRLLFGGVLLLTILLVAGGSLFAMRPPVTNSDEGAIRPIHFPIERSASDLSRDASDAFYTLRWLYSTDGGVSWAENKEIYNAGDAGMWMLDRHGRTVSTWGEDPNHMGVVADGNNNLHFLVVLNAFDTTAALNPLHRVNGLYDVRCSADGASVSYILVKQEQPGHKLKWADAGIDANGAIYTLWVDVQDTLANFRASKSTNDGDTWSQAFQVLNNLNIHAGGDGDMPYPHLTYNVGPDFFYVLYQTPGESGYDHHILKVPSALSGNVVAMETTANSATQYSYYINCVKPIAYDPTHDFPMFVFRNADGSTGIGNLSGGSWAVTPFAAAQRYPSCGLDMTNQVPWIFSNYGVAGLDSGQYHHNWVAFDELGYGGGSWQGPIVQDSILFIKPHGELYCHNGVWATGGNMVSGCSIWGSLTPEGYETNYSSDGANWHAPQQLFSIFAEQDPLLGGSVSMPQLVTGANNYVFVTFAAQYGTTDLTPPSVGHIENLSSFTAGQPWTCQANMFDAGGIQGSTINWWLDPYADIPDSLTPADADSNHADVDGNGTYYYHMPSDIINYHQLATGDTVDFYVDATDYSGNYTAGYTNMLIVNTGWLGVWQKVEVPRESQLGQNYPNPFNNTTVIPFALRHTGNVKLQVWDVNGRLISTLVNGRSLAGNHNVSWNTEGVTSGIYIYTLETADGRLSGKMTLLH